MCTFLSLLSPSTRKSFAARFTAALMPAVALFTLAATLSPAASAAPPFPPIPGPAIVVSEESTDQYLPAVAYNWKHDEFLAVWHNSYAVGSRDVWGRRFSSAGEPLGNAFLIASDPQKDRATPAVAYDPVNDRYLVVWRHEVSATDWDVFGRLIPWEGPVAGLTEFPIIGWTSNQWTPRVVYARGPQEFLVVWANELAPFWLINGVRVTAASGATVGFPLTIAHPNGHRVNPDVAYNMTRNEYLVVYDNGYDISGQRFDLACNPVGAEILIAHWADVETNPAVAASTSADQYLVGWQSDQGAQGVHGYVRFVTGNGTMPAGSGPFAADQHQTESAELSIACAVAGPNETGTTYLVSWEAQAGTPSAPFGIWGRFYGADFSAGPSFPILFGEDALARNTPAAAGGEGAFMVAGVQEAGHGAVISKDIYARFIAPYTAALPLVRR